jgi:hypothetical protein
VSRPGPDEDRAAGGRKPIPAAANSERAGRAGRTARKRRTVRKAEALTRDYLSRLRRG